MHRGNAPVLLIKHRARDILPSACCAAAIKASTTAIAPTVAVFIAPLLWRLGCLGKAGWYLVNGVTERSSWPDRNKYYGTAMCAAMQLGSDSIWLISAIRMFEGPKGECTSKGLERCSSRRTRSSSSSHLPAASRLTLTVVPFPDSIEA